MGNSFCFHLFLWFCLSSSILLISSDVEDVDSPPSNLDAEIAIEDGKEQTLEQTLDESILEQAKEQSIGEEEEEDVEAPLSKPLSILVFGGNGLLGADTVEKLLKLPGGANIYLVHRGNWYWDTAETIQPKVKRVFQCDRTRRLKDCSEFYEFLSKRTTYFDFVIDFSSLHPKVIEDALVVMKGTYIGFYIYISSDSVYEVCSKGNASLMTREEDSIRPFDPDEAKRLSALDSYGDSKLACEEFLTRHRGRGGPPFISLRLPDVIGSRDNTDRFWMTHILLNLHTFLMEPLKIPNDEYLMSFVYSADVASLIHSLVISADPLVFDGEAFNIAWPKPVSFHDFYSTIASSLPVGKPFKLVRAKESSGTELKESLKRHFFPSVTRGPLDVSKALSKLGWAPTELTKAVGKIVDFYKEASTKFPSNFKRALRGLNGRLDEETLKKASYGVYAVELSSGGCIDLHPKCALWAVNGECDKNPRWMKPNCMESCHSCHLLDEAQAKKQEKDEL